MHSTSQRAYSYVLIRCSSPLVRTVATVGLVESLLTLQLVDGLVDDGTREASLHPKLLGPFGVAALHLLSL